MALRTGQVSAADVRWLTAEEQRYWRAYVDGSARLMEALGRQLDRDSDMSLAEYDVLVHLSEAPDHTLRMSVLADELARSRSWLTHTVRRMEARGMVRRTSCDSDGRGVNCSMTYGGFERLRAAAPGHVDAVRRYLVDRLSPEDLATVGRAMGIIGSALRADGEGHEAELTSVAAR